MHRRRISLNVATGLRFLYFIITIHFPSLILSMFLPSCVLFSSPLRFPVLDFFYSSICPFSPILLFIDFCCFLFFMSAFISYIILRSLLLCFLTSIYIISPISSSNSLSFLLRSFHPVVHSTSYTNFRISASLHCTSLLQAPHELTDL